MAVTTLAGINVEHLRTYVIRPTLQKMGMHSAAAEDILTGITAQESAMGHFLRQHNDGPARGIFQMEPSTARDTIQRYIDEREDIEERFEAAFQIVNSANLVWSEISLEDITQKMITDLAFACACARIKLWMVPEPLPVAGDVAGYALYWKTHYNTAGGHGTASQFISNYRKYVEAA